MPRKVQHSYFGSIRASSSDETGTISLFLYSTGAAVIVRFGWSPGLTFQTCSPVFAFTA